LTWPETFSSLGNVCPLGQIDGKNRSRRSQRPFDKKTRKCCVSPVLTLRVQGSLREQQRKHRSDFMLLKMRIPDAFAGAVAPAIVSVIETRRRHSAVVGIAGSMTGRKDRRGRAAARREPDPPPTPY
jgi:hypothetical protein